MKHDWGQKTILIPIAVLAIGGLGLVAGCSDDGNTTAADPYGPESQAVDLNDEYGGFLAVDEDPAFGDPELQRLAADEEAVEDGYAGLDPQAAEEARRLEQQPDFRFYSLTVLWGDLQPEWNQGAVDSLEPGEPIVWDGRMTLSEGGIKLLSLLRFERAEDRILPRSERETIEWVSTTHGFMDGIRVLVIVPADSVTGEPIAQTLEFEAGDYTRTFSTDELTALDELVELGVGEKLSFRSYLTDPSSTRLDGFISGHWTRIESDSIGHFKGYWIGGRDGARLGYLQGHYGYDARGQQVFFGKYVDEFGNFRGFLRGQWETNDIVNPGQSRRATGSFQGEWVDRHGGALGRLRGHWAFPLRGRGVFSGAWKGGILTPDEI